MSDFTPAGPNDYGYLCDEIKKLREALAGTIAVWNKHYQSLPRSAEDDEFGAMLEARSALEMTPEWMLK